MKSRVYLKHLRKLAYLEFRQKNPHISALSMWNYIKMLESSGRLLRVMGV